MHKEAFDFIVEQRKKITEIKGKKIVDFGAYDHYFNVKGIFQGSDHVLGIDIKPGPGVDLVIDARDFKGTDYDVVVCAELLEHVPFPEEIIDAAWRALKEGGLLILTAAAPPRAPHCCMGLAVGNEYYTNIHPAALQAMLSNWSGVDIQYFKNPGDVRAVAFKYSDPQ